MAAKQFEWFPGKGKGPALETKSDTVVCTDHKPVVKDLCANDTGNHLKVKHVESTSHVECKIEKDGKVCFTPTDPKWCGEETVKYCVQDHFGRVKWETCVIKVPEPKPDHKVVANDDCFTIKECDTLCFDVLKNDCGDNLKIKWVSQPPADEGCVSIKDGKYLEYTAKPDADCINEVIKIKYCVEDCYGKTDEACVTVKVCDTGPHGQPTASMQANLFDLFV